MGKGASLGKKAVWANSGWVGKVNCLSDNVRLLEGSGNLIRSDGLKISISGVDDLIVIARGNEVMILPRGSSQDAKKFSG